VPYLDVTLDMTYGRCVQVKSLQSALSMDVYKVKPDMIINMYSQDFMMTVISAGHMVPLQILSRVGTEALKVYTCSTNP
jgi:hypothetical protein